MSDYLNKTEEQQFEEAKSWFKQNGTPILVAVFLVAAASFGWNFWKNHQVETALKASASYQQVMESYLQNPEKNAPLVEKFIADNRGSNYAVFAQLEKAKQQAEKGDFTAVKMSLTQALAEAQDPVMKNMIYFRLALVNYQLQDFDNALQSLNNLQDQAWGVRKQLLIGDIFAAKGDVASAKTAYEQAKSNANEQEKILIELRLNNL